MSETDDLKRAAQIMEQFKQQQQMPAPGTPQVTNNMTPGSNEFDNQGNDFASYGDGNSIGMGFDNQGESSNKPIITQNNPNTLPQPQVQQHVQPVQPQVQQPVIAPPPQMTPPPQYQAPTQAQAPAQPAGACPDCNTMHPPLRPGEKCPNASIAGQTESSNIDDATINKNLVDLRNIILAQMAQKGIKDGKKFFQYAVVALTRSLEEYKE